MGSDKEVGQASRNQQAIPKHIPISRSMQGHTADMLLIFKAHTCHVLLLHVIQTNMDEHMTSWLTLESWNQNDQAFLIDAEQASRNAGTHLLLLLLVVLELEEDGCIVWELVAAGLDVYRVLKEHIVRVGAFALGSLL